MIVHSRDDEFWIQFSYFPTSSLKIRLTVNSSADVSIATMYLTEKEMTRLNTDTVPCQEYDNTPNPHAEFVACCKDFFRSLNNWSKLKCLMPSFQDLVPDKMLKNCSDPTEAKEAHAIFNDVKWLANNPVCNDFILIWGYNVLQPELPPFSPLACWQLAQRLTTFNWHLSIINLPGIDKQLNLK